MPNIILRDDFEVSCPELDVLVEAALKVEKYFSYLRRIFIKESNV